MPSKNLSRAEFYDNATNFRSAVRHYNRLKNQDMKKNPGTVARYRRKTCHSIVSMRALSIKERIFT